MTHLFMWAKEQGSEFKRDDPPLHVGKGQRSDFKCDDPPVDVGQRTAVRF